MLPKNCVLPPNINENDFLSALEEFRGVVGDHVEMVDLDALNEGSYHNNPKSHDMYHFLEEKDLVASAIVQPGSTEEVQAVVKIANKYKIPIWVASIGRNLGYGGAAREMFCFRFR